jgi:hydrogenase nickel incorporation protein HypB
MAVRTIEVRERVMSRNNEIASDVRLRLAAHDVAAFNLVSSPGSGKTTLLERTLATLGDELGIAVMTGDVQTQNDADRRAAHTTKIVSAVVTNGACHLDALQVMSALENVGNLVCPAEFRVGEDARVMVSSITEGEDKPLKYPKMFRNAKHVVMTKTDLLPYVPFDVDRAVANALSINPDLGVFRVSALSGDGMAEWFQFLRKSARQVVARC